MTYYLISDGEVIVTPKIPEEVKAGNDFIVEITIQKGDLNHYARFLQKLPPGFTAYPINSKNAKFSFVDQNVKFTWLALPEEEEFTISYKVHVDTNIYGNFPITGKFAFVDQDFERKAIASSEWTTIMVINDNYKDKIFENAAIDPATDPTATACTRYRSIEGNEVNVNLKIERSKNKFAKIYEIIPEGFEAEGLETNNGIFNFIEGTAKIMWQDCPEGDFEVSYKLKPKSGTLTTVPEVNGTYYFMTENRNTLSVKIIDKSDPEKLKIETPADVADNNTATADTNSTTNTSTENSIADNTTTENTEDNSTTENNTAENNTTDNNTNSTDTENTTDNNLADNNTSQNTVETNNNTPPDNTNNQNGNTTKSTNNDNVSDVPDPQGGNGVNYKVQICALKSMRRSPSFFNSHASFRIPEKVIREQHLGWNKYLVGSFPVYMNARDYRNKLLNSTPISQAFIAAYNNGQRITVQEALMIAGQKWYK
jgi:hypothetical protein